MGLLAMFAVPRLTELKARTTLRASHDLLEASFATARASAMQKGKQATLSLSGNTVGVTVLSGLTNVSTIVMRPALMSSTFGTDLAALDGAPTSVVFDARGLVTPVRATIAKYQLTVGAYADTVCVSGAGVVLRRGCRL
jgi:Tfp pilus assembly protein FimT